MKREILKAVIQIVLSVVIIAPLMKLSDNTLYNGVSGWILAILAILSVQIIIGNVCDLLNED